jgi:LacI family transcriptional regulator
MSDRDDLSPQKDTSGLSNQSPAEPEFEGKNRAKPATMRDVSALAGVSAMTVSRVLHQDPQVLPPTRERVLKAVNELGYRRNELARTLRVGGGSAMVGLVVTNLANPFYSQLALGVESEIAEKNLTLVLGNTGEDIDRERHLISDFASRRVDGLLVVPAGDTQTHLSASNLKSLPVVLCARPPIDINVDCVVLDDVGGAFNATRWLIDSGHQRIGFLGPPAQWTSAERLRGFRQAMAYAALDVNEKWVRCTQRDVVSAEVAANQMLSMPHPPTALFCANSRNTIGAYRARRKLSRDVALAGFDDFELADTIEGPLAIVSYDTEELGRRAARMLLDRMAEVGQATAPQRVVLPTTLRTFDHNKATWIGELSTTV